MNTKVIDQQVGIRVGVQAGVGTCNTKPRDIPCSALVSACSKVFRYIAVTLLGLSVLGMVVSRLHGQSPNFVVSQEPPATPQTVHMFYNGSNLLEYLCKANAWKTQTQWSVSSGSLTSIQVASGVATVTTSAAHGLIVGTEVVITGSNTSSVNGTYTIATTGSATTFTLNKSLPDGTYTDNGLRIVSTQPKTSAAIWTIQKFVYSGTNVVDIRSSKSGQICDNRATTGTLQIAYQ